PHGALSEGTLTEREPVVKRPRNVRIRAGFAHAEKETHRQQSSKAEPRPDIAGKDHARQGGEEGPPHYDPDERPPGSEYVPQPAARHLERGVCQGERRKQPPFLGVVEVELRLDVAGHRAEAYPIQIRDHRQRARETENAVAHARGRFDQRWRGGHFEWAHRGRTSPTVLDPEWECNQRGGKKKKRGCASLHLLRRSSVIAADASTEPCHFPAR